jgi:YggT family protein
MLVGSANAFISLFNALFNFVLWAWLLRILLQFMRADFYNPFSQLIWRVTRHPTTALNRVVPPVRNFNLGAVLVVLVLAFIYMFLMAWIYNQHIEAGPALGYAVIKVIVLLLQLYMMTMSIQAVLSWFGPGVNNPASNVLWSLNEPFLRPIRRLVPPASGLDVSPLIVVLAMLFVSQVFASLLPPYYQ